MATFAYQALTPTGRLMQGTLEAGSIEEARGLLDHMQLKVNSIERTASSPARFRITRSQFLLFNQQLAAITKAGIPLERGLKELAADVASPSVKQVIQQVASDLEAGLTIEHVFEKRAKDLPPLYSRIIKAGLQSGRLSEMLTILNRHLELSAQGRRIIIEALTYPAIVLAVGSVVLTAVFLFMVPEFHRIHAEMVGGRSVHPLTEFVFSIPHYVIPFWTVVGLAGAAIALGLAACRFSDPGRRLREALLIRLPIIGRLWYAGLMSRFCQSMATLVAAGCDLPSCIRLGADATGSQRLILEAQNLARQVEQGRLIMEAGQLCRMIARLVLYSIQLGIQRNELQENLLNLADMYASQVKSYQARLSSTLLPTLLILIGGLLATAILAAFLPFMVIVLSVSA